MRYLNHDLPSLPLRAFRRGPDGSIKPQGGKDSPTVPDYGAAAQQTAQGNLDMARYATQANRADQITPFGNLTWANNRTFDQAGFDAAQSAYQNSLAAPREPEFFGNSGGDDGGGRTPNPNYSAPLSAPNRDDFFSGGDDWTQTLTFSPEMQALFNQQNQLQQGLFGSQNSALDRVQQTMGNPLDLSGVIPGGRVLDINSLPGGGTPFSPTGQGLSTYDPSRDTNAATQQLLSRINPELDRQQSALQTRLANQGLAPGSEAYKTALSQFGQQRNDAVTQAALQGINLGMTQQGQQFGQGLQNRGLLSGEQAQQFGQQQAIQQIMAALQNQQFGQSEQSRNRGIQEQAFLRNLPLNELNALRTGNQVGLPQFPGYSQQATTGGPNVLGATEAQYQANLGASNASNAGMSSMLGGILGVAGGGLGALYGGPTGAMLGSQMGAGLGSGFSDRRLKRHIRKVGKAGNGLNIYAFQYIWGGPMQLGYMADEVEKVLPEAVGEHLGFKTVNYGML